MDLSSPISDLFYQKSTIYRFLIFTVVFAFLFIEIINPFSIRQEDKASDLVTILYSIGLALIGVTIVAISRFAVRARGRKHTITYGQLLVWSIFAELIPLTVVYTAVSLHMSGSLEWEMIVIRTFVYITLLLLLLYSIFVMSLLYKQKNKEMREMREMGVGKEEHPKSNVALPFYDEKGELKVSIHKTNLLYIESADNYVYLWYINKDAISKMLIRNTLKKLEVQLSKTNIMRCHRSYMINLDHVSMIRKEKGNLFAVFDITGVTDIPVSGSYYDQILKSFISH